MMMICWCCGALVRVSSRSYSRKIRTEKTPPVNEAATGTSGCVCGGSTIRTSRGPVSANSIRESDLLLSFDHTDRTWRERKVVRVGRSIADTTVLINEELRVSPRQRLFEKDQGWIPAYAVLLGMQLLADDGYRSVHALGQQATDTQVFEFSL